MLMIARIVQLGPVKLECGCEQRSLFVLGDQRTLKLQYCLFYPFDNRNLVGVCTNFTFSNCSLS
jgi:hypothetical protein